jgi:hypothetical protein
LHWTSGCSHFCSMMLMLTGSHSGPRPLVNKLLQYHLYIIRQLLGKFGVKGWGGWAPGQSLHVCSCFKCGGLRTCTNFCGLIISKPGRSEQP